MNSKGFVTYSFVIFFPLFLSLVFMVCWSFWFLNQKHQLDNICNYHVLKAQEVLVQHNNQLMALNANAWSLILEKRSLDALILIGAPPTRAAAQARKRMVVSQQYALKKIQKSLIYKANFFSKKEAYSLKKKFYGKTKNIARFWGQPLKNMRIHTLWRNSQVEPLFKEIAPPYKYSQSYNQKQEIQTRWNIPLRSLTPKWLTEYIPIHNEWKGQCFSHPKKRNIQWIAQIGKAKPL